MSGGYNGGTRKGKPNIAPKIRASFLIAVKKIRHLHHQLGRPADPGTGDAACEMSTGQSTLHSRVSQWDR